MGFDLIMKKKSLKKNTYLILTSSPRAGGMYVISLFDKSNTVSLVRFFNPFEVTSITFILLLFAIKISKDSILKMLLSISFNL